MHTDPGKQAVMAAKESLQHSLQPSTAVKAGDRLPEFRWKDSVGLIKRHRSSFSEAFAITFYLG